MKSARPLAAAVLAFSLLALPAQAAEAVGRWQGLLQIPGSQQPIRTVIRIEERRPGELLCFANFIERGADPFRCTGFTVEGDKVRFTIPQTGGRFEGDIKPGGATLEGTWSGRPISFARTAPADAWRLDASTHQPSLIRADDGTFIEVLDFGGSGPPLLFVAGQNATGHVFDAFAARLTAKHRVYAVTRRGFGYSDQPPPSPETYSARRLGDDVLSVMTALKLDRPILAAWSMGGSEVSSIASRYPERIAAAVYLDAAYAYAYYAPGNLIPAGANPAIAVNALAAKIRASDGAGILPAETAKRIDDILRTDLPALEAELRANREMLLKTPEPAAPGGATPAITLRIFDAMGAGQEGFPALKVPVLAIFAIPAQGVVSQTNVDARRAQIDRYRAGNPNARVVEIKDADHAVFRSHPQEVVREMEAFLDALPRD